MISFVLFACGMAKKNKRELSPSALTECISNKHHNNVKGNSRAIFSSIVLSLSRSYYRRFFNNSAKRYGNHLSFPPTDRMSPEKKRQVV